MGLITQKRKIKEEKEGNGFGVRDMRPRIKAEEMFWQFRVFATLEENGVWFPTPQGSSQLYKHP